MNAQTDARTIGTESADELLTVEQAAAELGKTGGRIRHYINQKRLPAQRVGGGARAAMWLIRRADLESVRHLKPGWPVGKPRSQAAGDAARADLRPEITVDDPTLIDLAAAVGQRTGESLDQVVSRGIRTVAQAAEVVKPDPQLVEDLLEIGRHCAALPTFDDRSPDEIIGYDEHGIPT